MYKTWDIFCRVVDNFGDAGVSWRLASHLSGIRENRVRLWIDDPSVFVRLCPTVSVDDLLSGQHVLLDGVEIRYWPPVFPVCMPADIVVEAFGCQLPESFINSMLARKPSPVWLNLEYLSAESWVQDCHLLPSIDSSSLTKYFFFPGFTDKTGGILRDSTLKQHQGRFDRTDWLTERGIKQVSRNCLLVSLFSYEQQGLSGLIDCWSNHSCPVHVLVPEGKVLKNLSECLGNVLLKVGDEYVQKNLSICVLPFSDQNSYDQLLWACDLNFVRGEDSFVRAQWAEKPFVWHIYPQDEETHYVKLEAFMAMYTRGLSLSAASALKQFWNAWNGRGNPADFWSVFSAALPELNQHARNWAAFLHTQTDLATQLDQFCSHIIQLGGKIRAL